MQPTEILTLLILLAIAATIAIVANIRYKKYGHPLAINTNGIVYTKKQIQSKVKALAAQINTDYADKQLTVVCVLQGAALFFADLVRQLKMPVVFAFVNASSYGNHQTPMHAPLITHDANLVASITASHVLIVEDVVGSGATLRALRELFETMNPESLAACALIEKRSVIHDAQFLDYRGFTLYQDIFVAGYGMDNKRLARNTEYIFGIDKKEE